MRVLPQPAGVAQSIPGPADHRSQRQRNAGAVAPRAKIRQPLTQLRDVNADQAHSDADQRRKQAPPRQLPVALAVEQIGEHRQYHRQRADNHGGNRRPGALNGAGQTDVIDKISHHRQTQRGPPVVPAQLAQTRAPEPCQRQGDQTQRQIASHRLQHRRILWHQQRPDEN